MHVANDQLRTPLKRAPRPRRKLRAAEFFAGIGLVRLALEKQRQWSVVYANDIEPMKARMYRDNWTKNDHLVVGDIHNIHADSVPTVELFTASFPCNDLSIAGRWDGLSGKESSAFYGLIRILDEMGDRRPPLVLLENVVGFLQADGGEHFETALMALNRLGYTVDAFILNARHWVPQSRARLFVVARVSDAIDSAEVEVSDTRPEALCRFIDQHPHIRWSIRELPRLPKLTTLLPDIVQDLPEDDEHWWNDERADYLMTQLSNRHEVQARLLMANESWRYATAFRRVRYGRSMAELRTDGIAGCLRTPRGGSGRQILIRLGKGQYRVRLLTARECARLQGVPDDYVINAPLNQALFGFGDAVCVSAVEWIAKHYLTPVARELPAPIEAGLLFR
ncbi:MAG TPA: DNA (cytosine-5-)-methyltransferase [Tepidisphaeraceae bacterium]|jgi:DNA (cytosine-5)-methyltransferase 1